MERQLVADYFALVDELANTLTGAKLDLAVELANVPDQIRGFGHIKERNVQAALLRRSGLLESYRAPSGAGRSGTLNGARDESFDSVVELSRS